MATREIASSFSFALTFEVRKVDRAPRALARELRLYGVPRTFDFDDADSFGPDPVVLERNRCKPYEVSPTADLVGSIAFCSDTGDSDIFYTNCHHDL